MPTHTINKLNNQRLALLFFFVILAWLGVYFSKQSGPTYINHEKKVEYLPPFDTWTSFSLETKGYPKVRLSKKQQHWYVNIDQDQQTRRIDSHLLGKLETELNSAQIIEKRPLTDQETINALALSDSAIKVTVKSSNTAQSKLEFKLGSEHLRHSTWIQIKESKEAWLIKGRLRKILAHLPHRWYDRRMTVKGKEKLKKLTCYQGEHTTPSHLRQRTWTIVHQEDLWQLEEFMNTKPKISPHLDKATLQGFIYTLSTLRVDRFLNHHEFINTWKATHTCLWQSPSQKGWVSFGQLSFAQQESFQGQSIYKFKDLTDLMLVKSSDGIGTLPQHIAHFIILQFRELLNRRLYPGQIESLQKIEYIATPSPLIVNKSEIIQHSWVLEKKKTGWWKSSLIGKVPISQNSINQWFNNLTKDAASADYLSLISRLDPSVTGNPTLILTSAETSLCKSKKNSSKDKNRSEPYSSADNCLIQIHLKFNEKTKLLKTWVREEDQVSFSLSQPHHQSLVLGPKP